MDNYPRCQTCRWFDPDGNGWGRCDATILKRDGAWEYAESKAIAQDWDDASGAYLYTRNEFGCVQHEPKGGN